MLRYALILTVISLLIFITLVPSADTSSKLLRLTNTSEQSLSLNPQLSDDGRVVVFESSADLANVGGTNSFHTIRASITSVAQGFEELARSRATSISVSGNGDRIVFASNEDLLGENSDRNSEIYLSAGSKLNQLTHTNSDTESARLTEGNFEPSISNDGRWITFVSNRNLTSPSPQELFLIDTITGTIIQLTTSTVGSPQHPNINADGTRIFFIQKSPESNTAELVYFDVGSKTARVVASNINELKLSPGGAISNDGHRLVYSATTSENQSQVFLFDLRLGESRQLTKLGTRSTDVSLNPSISGDGKRVTFATRRRVDKASDGSVEVYLVDIPTSTIQQLTDAPASATAEVISSVNQDGSVVAFNFPRVLSGSLTNTDLANNSEIYVAFPESRPEFGTVTVKNAANKNSTSSQIAPDSIASVSGNELSSRIEQAKLVDGNLPFAINETTVQVNGKPACLIYASPEEVLFLVPGELRDGPAEVLLTNSEGFPSKAMATIVQAAPGLFNDNDQAIILDADTLKSGPFDPTNDKIRIVVFATGARHASDATINIAGESITADQILPSTFPGLDEIYLHVPAQLRGAGSVPISIKANSTESNFASVNIGGSSVRDIVINEILADPPDGPTGDANHDGSRDSSADEFIELVNTTTRDFDLTGYQLQTRTLTASNDTTRHRFQAGTILSAGTALVVFGGGQIDVSTGVFGGALVSRASTTGLSLSNSGGVVTLRDASGVAVTSIRYGDSVGIAGDANQSITRFPDVLGTLQLHQAASEVAAHFSPGTRVDGSSFLPSPAIAKIVIAPGAAQLLKGQSIQLSAKAFDANESELTDVIFSWTSTNNATISIDTSGTAKALEPGVSEITARGRGVESAKTIVTVTAPIPSPTPTPAPSPTPTPTASPTPLPAVVISELRTRGPNGASDEFVEIFNNSDLSVSIAGWKLRASSSTGAIGNRLVFPSGTNLPARRHILIANSAGYSGAVLPDFNFTTGLANDGGLALTLANDVAVDQVGLSAGSAFREGMHLSPLPSDADQSYERRAGLGLDTLQDTADNFNDFFLLTPSTPQNLSGIATPSPSPSPSPSPTPSPTATPTPPPSPSPTPPPLLISEFRTRGPNGASDEFVEVYNNSDQPVAASGLKIRGSSNTGGITTRLTIASNMVIPARGHFLAVNSSGYSGKVTGDQSFTSGFANDGGVALTMPDDSIIDQVGLSQGSAFKEGNPLSPLTTDANQSYERKPGGLFGSTQDTNENVSDFQVVPSDPQNTLSNSTPGPTPSPSPSPTASPTPSPSPSPSPSASPTPRPSGVVISQVFGGGGNSGAPFRNDFIEIFNAGNTAVSLSGWSIQYAGATASTWSVTNLNNLSLAPGQYYLVQEASGGSTGQLLPTADATGTISMAATAGKVALVQTTTALSGLCPVDSNVVDLVGYGTTASCFEGTAAPAPNNSIAIVRKSGGCSESDNNANDFAIGTPLPRNTITTFRPCMTTAVSSSYWFQEFAWVYLSLWLVLRKTFG